MIVASVSMPLQLAFRDRLPINLAVLQRYVKSVHRSSNSSSIREEEPGIRCSSNEMK